MTKTGFPARRGKGSPPTFYEAEAAAGAAAAAAAPAQQPHSLSRPLTASAVAQFPGLGNLRELNGLGGPILSASGPADFKDLKEMAGEWRRGQRGGGGKESRRSESKS